MPEIQLAMDANRKIQVMGIVNLTDNSYYAPSRTLSANGDTDIDAFLERVERLLEEGADIIDIGACSTGPGTDPVGEAEEWRRLEPALKALSGAFPGTAVSVDTYWAGVVEKTFETYGHFLVNDVSAGEADVRMLPTVGKLGLPYVAMHMRGTPKTMQTLTDYDDVTKDVKEYFRGFARRAEEAGIKDWILDPGFGFAKTIEQNYQLLREMGAFLDFDRPILVGVSRKSMVYRLFGITPEEALPATQALHLKALQNGASILRVHDVKAAKQTVDIYRLLR